MTLAQRWRNVVHTTPTVSQLSDHISTIFQRWANVVMLSGLRWYNAELPDIPPTSTETPAACHPCLSTYSGSLFNPGAPRYSSPYCIKPSTTWWTFQQMSTSPREHPGQDQFIWSSDSMVHLQIPLNTVSSPVYPSVEFLTSISRWGPFFWYLSRRGWPPFSKQC